MLKACPAVLQQLLDQYEALVVQSQQGDGPQLRSQLADLTYTLCVTTGTKDVETALEAAHTRLAEQSPTTGN